jgi:quercetin dioxygenase-like cupin family protein
MDAFAIDRSDGREDGEDWTENYEELPGGANISIILESTTKAGVGPRLHKHPYAETFIIRRGWATFTVGSEEFRGHAGQVLVVPAETPHKFSTGPDGYEGVHIHAGRAFRHRVARVSSLQPLKFPTTAKFRPHKWQVSVEIPTSVGF